jgi:diguanylate cyclase (GGDEF)-like protein
VPLMRKSRIIRTILQTIIVLLYLWPLAASGTAATAVEKLPALAVSGHNPTIEIAAHAEYLLDSLDTFRYQDIVKNQLPFQRHTKDSFQFSFKKATLWIKCRIAPADPEGAAAMSSRRSFLVFDNAALGSVTLFVPVIKDGLPDIIELKGGWHQGGQSQEFPFLYPTFVLPEGIDHSRPVIIRIATPFALQFRATLYTIDAFQEKSFILFLIIGFCTGILVAMLLYNLVLYLFMRDKQYLFYILYVLFLLIWQCVLFGFFRYFPYSVGELMISHIAVFACLMMLFAIIFAIVFLDTAKTARRHDIILKGLAVLMIILILMIFLQYLWITNILAYLTGQVITVALFTSAFSSLRSGFKPALYYLIAVAVLLIAAIIFLFKFYGLIPNNTLTMHIMLFGSATESILLSFALGYRIRLMREQQQTFHERERSLQEISMTDELTGLFNRRFLSASLIKKISAVRRNNACLSLLMMDVDHFKDLNDTYGHPEGDKILVSLGKVLIETLREEDIACRYGGEEFVAILHNADKNAALEVSERLRSRFECVIFTPGVEKAIHMTISIGVAELLPDESPEKLLFRADQAMYQAKQKGRNRICSA